MRILLQLLVLIIVSLASCNNEDPQPVEPQVTGTPTPDQNPSAGSGDHSQKERYPDSAFYRARIFSGLPYRIMYPRNYDSATLYPLVLFLHGIDERGYDNENQLKWGASLFQSDSVSRQYPAIVVFPQCPITNRWYDEDMLPRVKNLLDYLVTSNSVDMNRIYIEGLSMGAFGTYAMVAEYPEMFAAAVAIAGDGDETKAKRMAKVDWKIYGGKKDTRVPSKGSEKMASALRKSGANVSVKIYPDADHRGTWVRAFAEPDFVSWVFEKRKE
jgi:predicted peptidase